MSLEAQTLSLTDQHEYHGQPFPLALEVMMSGPRIVDDGQHGVVALGDQNVPGADEELGLIALRPGLVKPLGEVVEVENDEVRGAAADDSDELPYSHSMGEA